MKRLKALALAATIGGSVFAYGVANSATTVSLNVDPSLVVESPGETVGDSRYRLSNTNWDMGIAPAGNPIGSFAQKGLGTVSQLSGNTYDFEVKYTSNSGYSFKVFGTFGTTTDPSVSWTTADGTKNGKTATDTYNAILLQAQSTLPNGATSTSLTVSNLLFSVTGATTSGTLDTNLATSSAGSPVDLQWLVADGDLAATTWTLTGTLNGVKTATGCDECVKFDVYTKNVSVVPIPAALPLLGTAVASLGLAGWRKRRAA